MGSERREIAFIQGDQHRGHELFLIDLERICGAGILHEMIDFDGHRLILHRAVLAFHLNIQSIELN